jgi:hypothetical protein
MIGHRWHSIGVPHSGQGNIPTPNNAPVAIHHLAVAPVSRSRIRLSVPLPADLSSIIPLTLVDRLDEMAPLDQPAHRGPPGPGLYRERIHRISPYRVDGGDARQVNGLQSSQSPENSLRVAVFLFTSR